MSYRYDSVTNITKMSRVPGNFPLCDAPLASVSKKDVAAMAGGLMYLLKREVSEEAVLDTLFEKYGAMAELEKSYPESREMLEGLVSQ